MVHDTSKPLGIFYAIGVGPGAPDLLTLRALECIKSVDVLVIPRPSPYSPSVAGRIVEPHLGTTRSDQERIFLTFPMTKDPEVLLPAWEFAVSEISSRLKEGRDVGFITQGDPMVYSTFIYLYERIIQQHPSLRVQIIPGVSSLSAVPAAAGIPLADGQERVAVIPATYGLQDLRQILRTFDAILLMKVSSCIPEVTEALAAEGLLDSATYVERATCDNQRIIRDIRSLKGDRCVYFSMIFVHKKQRSGVLSGPTTTKTQSLGATTFVPA